MSSIPLFEAASISYKSFGDTPISFENILATVSRSVESLDLSASEMANHSQTTSARAENVAQASEESSNSIQLIVAATEELVAKAPR